ncbi:MAG: NAD(P)/FAD-dependent oxidoreductase [Betaproteobacteria bacterium]|nr:NAD(P)/FAD-dependent oxidoreductase [Betaproteobacteria bacterium]
MAAQAGISTHWRKQVEAVLGEQEVEGVRLRDLDGGASTDLPCSGFFAYVGLAPASGFLPATIARDAEGRLLTDAALQTSMPGVYAAGAVRAGYGGLLTHAMADGVAAARSACARIRA